jgi:hypothetical protein
MKKVLILTFAVLAAACATQDKKAEELAEIHEKKSELADEVIDNTPDWYLEPPSSTVGIFGVGTAYSESLQFSLNKAKLQAKYSIASAYEQKLSGNQKSYSAETSGAGSSFQSTDKQIIDQFVAESDISGTTIEEKVFVREKTGFRAYILAFYPIGDNNQVKQAKHKESLMERTDSSMEAEHKKLLDRVKDSKAKSDTGQEPQASNNNNEVQPSIAKTTKDQSSDI